MHATLRTPRQQAVKPQAAKARELENAKVTIVTSNTPEDEMRAGDAAGLETTNLKLAWLPEPLCITCRD